MMQVIRDFLTKLARTERPLKSLSVSTRGQGNTERDWRAAPFSQTATKYLPKLFSGPMLALVSFVVYLRTLAPGVYGFDSAELSTGAYTLGIVHPPGYPLYLLIGKLFTFLPFASVAYRLNLMSAVLASLTVMLVFNLILRLNGERVIAWSAVALFAFSNSFWQLALVAEVYTLHTFFLAANLLLIERWRSSGNKRDLIAFAFCYGLGLANHTSGVLFAPGFAWLIASSPHWRWREWKILAGMAGLCLLGLTPYLYLPLRAMASPALNYVGAYYNIDLTRPAGAWWMMSGQAYRIFAFGYSLQEVPGELLRFGGSLWRNFFGAGVIFGLIGIGWLLHKRSHWVVGLLLVFAANVVFFTNYRVMDKDTMFLPAYLVWAVFVAEGVETALKWIQRLFDKGLLNQRMQPVFKGLPAVLAILALVLNWRWADMSQVQGPAMFAQEVMRTAESDATVVAQWSPAVVLEYFQIVEGQRPDLVIYNRSRSAVAQFYMLQSQGLPRETILQEIQSTELEMVHHQIARGPVYVVEYDPLFAKEYEYLPVGNYYQLAPHAPPDERP